MSPEPTIISGKASMPKTSGVSRDLEADILQCIETNMTNDDELPTLEVPLPIPATNRPQRPILAQSDLEPTLLPTPDQTPTRAAKRTFATAFNPSSSPSGLCKCATESFCPTQLSPSKNPSKAPSEPRSKRPFHPPPFSILHRKTSEVTDLVSGIELQRAAEAVLAQVRWDEVSWDVASNRSGAYYQMVIRRILQEKIDEIEEMRAVLQK